eukprot:jgi/Botrbrau1/19344/Bobra.0073s0069.1
MRHMGWLVYIGSLLGFTVLLASGARIDHVIIGTSDVVKAATMLSNKYGLDASSPAGYDGNGLISVVVPLGGSFLRLVQLTAEATSSSNPLNKAILAAAAPGGNPFVAFVIAPDEALGNVSTRLGSLNILYRSPENLGPISTPTWNITGLEGLLWPPLPFFISWADPTTQSGETMKAYTRSVKQSGSMPTGIGLLQLSGDVSRFNKWVGLNTVPVRWVEGKSPGIVSVIIDTAGGSPITLRAADLWSSAL